MSDLTRQFRCSTKDGGDKIETIIGAIFAVLVGPFAVYLLAAVDPVIGVIVVALVGPLGAYILAARKMSGKINTTEAAQLWEESRSIREWSKGRIADCENECGRLRSDLQAALSRVSDLESELKTAKAHIEKLEKGIT